MLEKNDPRVTAYVLGELSVEEVAEVEQQIQASPELREFVESIRGLSGELALAYQSEEDLSLSGSQKETPAQTTTIELKKKAPAKSDEARRWLALATAACLAAIAFGGWFWLDGMGRNATGQSADGFSFYTPGETGNVPASQPENEVRFDDRQDGSMPESARYSDQSLRGLNIADENLLEEAPSPTDAENNLFESELESLADDFSARVAGGGRFSSGGILGGGGFGGGGSGSSRLIPGQSGNEIGGWRASDISGENGSFGPPRLPPVPERLRGGEFLDRDEDDSPADRGGRVGTGHPNYESGMRRQGEGEGQGRGETQGEGQGQNSPDDLAGMIKDEESKSSNSPMFLKGKDEAIAGKLAESKNGRNKQDKTRPKSWKRVKATPNTTRLMVGNQEELSLNGMQVNAQIDGFRARVLVDYFYYNDQEGQLEGNFKLRLPDDASLYYFAFGESVYDISPKGKLAAEEFLSDGTQFVSLGAPNVKQARQGQWDNVKEARMVPREKAAHAYRETVRRRIDPALVEWSGAGVFSAKVFPLSPKKLHRIVVGYDVNLKRVGDDLKFELSLPEQTGQCRVEVNVQSIEGMTCTSEPQVDPVTRERDGTLQKRFVFDGDAAPLTEVELILSGTKDVVLTSQGVGGQKGKGFWTMQVTPDLPSEEVASSSRAIFLLDTSLSSNPEKFSVWLSLLEQTLTRNRDSLKEFDVLCFNIDTHFWKGKYVANTADNVAELKQDLENLALEGATDLYAAADAITNSKWITAGDAGPDLFLLSDGAATWGETDLRMIGQRLQSGDCGSLFAYQTGLTGTAISNLRFLAGQSGGAVFSVATEEEVQTASTAHRKRPWKLASVVSAGARDILSAGRVEYVYPGQTITVVGRGEVDPCLELSFEQGEEKLTETVVPVPLQSELASRMYGHVSVGQLENLGSEKLAESVATAYARHFRITGRTCSLLMLDSEEDYQRFDIKPEEDEFVVNAKAASTIVEATLDKHAADLADPKARLKAWLKRLESMPGMKFQWPTALELVFDDIEVETIAQPLSCQLTETKSLSTSYLNVLNQRPLDYDAIAAEALSRKGKSVDDMLKVYSSLIERNPGDITVARDVAFTAMELERPAAAFHLLRRVAKARPFQGNIYPAIGQCLAQLGKADMAMVYYEVAINGSFERQGNEFKSIVAAEYMYLLRQMVSEKLDASAAGREYAKARLDTLGKHLPFGSADVLITMMWNQDQTDVDLHVVEPSGEECFYKHTETRSGGHITSDITTGFGPEMYYNANAPNGQYQIKAKFYGSGQNRRSTRNKVYMTVVEDFGGEAETLRRETVELRTVGEFEKVMSVGVK